MKFIIKKQIISIFLFANYILHKVPILIKAFDLFIGLHFSKYKKISLKKHDIFLLDTNFFTRYRNQTFFSKEPETLNWIDSFNKSSVLYDIGANVGLYSIYAAKTKDCIVNAFEPCFFNTDYLAKNIFKNLLNNKITIFPVVLGNFNKTIAFSTPNTMSGNALSQADFQNVKANFSVACKYTLPCFTMDDIIKYFKLPQPDHIKIDVDGAELEILEGSTETLQNLKSLLIEVDHDDSLKKNKIKKLLKSNDFKLKFQSVNDKANANTYNQIWIKRI